MRHPAPYKLALHSNGRYWIARWYDAAGRRQTKGIGAKRKLSSIAAAQECSDLERRVRRDQAGGVPTLATAAARTFEARHDLKEKTKRLYRVSLAYFQAFAALHMSGDRTNLEHVRRTDASGFLAWLMEEREGARRLSYSSAVGHAHRMRSIYEMLIDELADGGSPPLANPFAKRRWSMPEVAQDWAEVGPAELKALMAACPNDSWRRFLGLCRWAGLRKGEALRLRVRDVNQATRMLTVLPEPDEHGARLEGTKQRARHVPARPELMRLLGPSLDGEPDALVCGQIPPRNFDRALYGGAVGGQTSQKRRARRYVGLVARAGLAPIRKLPHTLRRNCGTEWAGQGIPITDVARWMGHSVAVAAKYYLRATPDTLSKVTGLRKLAKPLAKRRKAGRVKQRLGR